MSETETKSEYVTNGSDSGFMTDVIAPSNDVPVLVDFWAPWCEPCKTLAPTLERLVEAQDGKVKLVKIDTEQFPGIAGQLRVRSIPMIFAFRNGKPVDAFTGALPESKIQDFIDKQING